MECTNNIEHTDILYSDWSVPSQAKHNVRALCDLGGLTLYQKDVLTACVRVESNFLMKAKHENRSALGIVLSTDWGIVQVNDYYHIGHGKDFPSVEYVLANPGACVQWMVKYYHVHGNLNPWVSYTSGTYIQYMPHK